MSEGLRAQIEENRKRSLLFWFVLVLFVGIACALDRSQAIRYQSDLFARWYAGRMLFSTGRNLYDLANGVEAIAYKTLPTTPLEASFFYPAHLVLLLLPLIWLPFQWAHVLWTVCVQLFFFLGIWRLTRATGWPSRANQLLVFVLLALFFIPTIQQTIWSQFDTLGVLAMGMVYGELVREDYFYAGLWACGFTFKPQGTAFLLAFLLFWALFERRRWQMLLGFALGCLGLWAATEILQPGWVGNFLAALRDYQKLPYQIQSVVDIIWNPGQVLSILIVFSALTLVFLNRKAEPGSLALIGIILLGLSISWLVIPIIGMLYLVLLPPALILLLSALEKVGAMIYRWALFGFTGLYVAGCAGLLIGLALQSLPGLHIQLAQLFYKILTPLLVLGLAAWLCVERSMTLEGEPVSQG
jgi:hypothetical protein